MPDYQLAVSPGADRNSLPSIGLTSLPSESSGARSRAAGTACQRCILPPPPKGTIKVQIWDGANKSSSTPLGEEAKIVSGGKRGRITSNNAPSMRRCRRFLAEIPADTPAWTTALTYPAEFPVASVARDHMRRLQRWISKKFRDVGLVYKREPQKRGATHYHLLYFAESGEERAKEFFLAAARKWCEISTGGDELQLKWHLDLRNFQSMRGESFFNYLGKYLSKNDEVPGDYDFQGGGKWWGVINRSSIPLVAPTSSELPPCDANKRIMRTLYKLRQRRAELAVAAAGARMMTGLPSNRYSPRETLELAKSHPSLHQFLILFIRSQNIPLKASKLPRAGSVTLLGSTACETMSRIVNFYSS